MSDWQDLTLSEIVELVGGGTPKTTVSAYWNGDIPWLSVVDFNTGRKYVTDTEKKITKAGLENSSTKLLNAGDIILSARGTVGAMAVLSKPMTFNQSCYGLRGLANKSDTGFIYYLVKDAVERLQQISHGGVFDTITRDTFKDITLPIPSLEDQKAIASVLSSLDDKIDLLHRQNTTLESMAETLFRQWFVEEAQEDWEEVTIADLIEFNPPRKLSKNQISTYIDMAGLDTSNFNPTGWYQRAFSSGTKFINNDTLLARITPCLENGKTGYVSFLRENEVGWGSTEFIVMRPKLGIHPFFAYVLARYQDFRDYAEGCMEGSSGRQRVNTDHLKQYGIKMPSNEIIKCFNNLASAITPKLELNAVQIQTLEKLRDNLLPKLISGEIRVI